MTLNAPRALGSTGVAVGPIGISSTFGRTTKDIEWAFELGCTYLVLKPHRQPFFVKALKSIIKGHRDKLALAVEASPSCGLSLRLSTELTLRRMKLHHIDFLLLSQREGIQIDPLFETATKLQQQGKIRFLGLALPRRKKNELPLHRLSSSMTVVHAPVNAVDSSSYTRVFSANNDETKPAIVGFAATHNGSLLRSRPGILRSPSVSDCYRFALSQPGVAVCLAGSPHPSELKSAIDNLRHGMMTEEQTAWMMAVADAVKGTARRISPKSRVVAATRPNEVTAG